MTVDIKTSKNNSLLVKMETRWPWQQKAHSALQSPAEPVLLWPAALGLEGLWLTLAVPSLLKQWLSTDGHSNENISGRILSGDGQVSSQTVTDYKTHTWSSPP